MISIKVEIDPILEGLNKSAVILIIKNVLDSEGIQDASISFIFGSDELLSGLKKEFFNKKQWTDVIAFRMNDYGKGAISCAADARAVEKGLCVVWYVRRGPF